MNRNYEAALKVNTTLIGLDPKNANRYVNQSVLYASIQKFGECLKALEQGLKVDPKNVLIYNNLAYYNGHNNHYASAIKYANIGLSLTKDSDERGVFYNNRGYAELQLNKLKQANQDFDLAMAWNPTNSFAYYYKALAVLKTKNYFELCKYVSLSEAHGGKELVANLKYKYCH